VVSRVDAGNSIVFFVAKTEYHCRADFSSEKEVESAG
jgi:hypothetical protein